MARYAILEGGSVTNVVVASTDFAVAQGWVEIPSGTPADVGWSHDGTTWTAPTPPPLTSIQVAQQTVAQLAASIPGHISQATLDAQTISGITPGQALTSEQVTALTNHAEGWVSLLGGLQALLEAQGVR